MVFNKLDLLNSAGVSVSGRASQWPEPTWDETKTEGKLGEAALHKHWRRRKEKGKRWAERSDVSAREQEKGSGARPRYTVEVGSSHTARDVEWCRLSLHASVDIPAALCEHYWAGGTRSCCQQQMIWKESANLNICSCRCKSSEEPDDASPALQVWPFEFECYSCSEVHIIERKQST